MLQWETGADGIDVTDPRWVVYLTYERSSAPGDGGEKSFTPVGYVTLFKFINPLGRKLASGSSDPNPTSVEQNERHRICQVLIFPTHQRQGHGEHLVQCISQRAVANDKVYELTVEDPVPAFAKVCWNVMLVLKYQKWAMASSVHICWGRRRFTDLGIKLSVAGINHQLRDLVDVKNCLKQNFFSLPPSASTTSGDEVVPAAALGTASLTARDIRGVQEVRPALAAW